MSKNWLREDEYIVLEGKVWVWIKGPLGPNLTKSRLFLTNYRLYGKDALFRIKLFDFPLDSITKIESTKKYLRIEAEVKGRKHKIDLSQKNLDGSWEWMIKERIKAFDR
ncbi:MAG: hypothetical protein JSW00_16235 [Thermoplasmata archaeon]|nr:MAG: hypothetical protein JSW00_16235 [Thermoplasmata archaeon]